MYTNLNLPNVLIFVFSNRIELNSKDWKQARAKILKNYRTYKSNICKGFKSLIATLSKQDDTLLEISDQSFTNKVGKTFNSPNFFYYFYFIKNYLNVEGSTPLGKQYLKTIYINLAIRVRQQYLKPQNKKADDWIKVLDFFNKVALLPAYDNVDLYDFQ